MSWWVRQIALVVASCFFIAFGIHVLILAYQQENPFSFIMTFFASNLIILISATLLIGFVIRMKNVANKAKSEPDDEGSDDDF